MAVSNMLPILLATTKINASCVHREKQTFRCPFLPSYNAVSIDCKELVQGTQVRRTSSYFEELNEN